MIKENWNKLVRDNIIPDLQRKGVICEFAELSDEESIPHFYTKLDEELAELKQSVTDQDMIEEIVDLMEVLSELALRIGVKPEDLETALRAKRMTKGGFKKNLFLISTLESK
jgi:predicted house-cleaning noncanonical NTP pyrophosphatase (MazG superfamily)